MIPSANDVLDMGLKTKRWLAAMLSDERLYKSLSQVDRQTAQPSRLQALSCFTNPGCNHLHYSRIQMSHRMVVCAPLVKAPN